MGEKLGMIGLGKMGLALSKEFLADGHEMLGYDVDEGRMKMLEGLGGKRAASAKEIAEQCDITFSILLKEAHIEENTFGPNGIVAAGKKGLIHVEMSTMKPAFQADMGKRLATTGIKMLDAPISGSHPRVASRQISMMVGGVKEAFDRVYPILDSITSSVVHMGENGKGATMKVVTNLFVNSRTALICEMLLTGRRAGLDDDAMMECLRASTVKGTMLENAAPRIMNRDWEARGAVEIFVKDMGLAIDLAKENGVELQVVPAARKMFQRAEAAGWGKDDAARVFEVYEGKDK
ncbi:MAG: NAD(P)-dependent oxidoreductase [Nitrospinaceae bacterium]|nr:NAD(P)-dependent oxidoreductase [Nitrospinaceae bacterium]